MITLQVPQEEWETALTYWHELANDDKVKHDGNLKKIEFLNQTIFNNDKIAGNSSNTNVDVPSVTAITDLMNEIESEIGNSQTKLSSPFGRAINDDDIKDSAQEILNKKENITLKEFVSKPVK